MESFVWHPIRRLVAALSDTTPRPGLQAVPGTIPLSITAAALPPLIYYVALILLPPISTDSHALKVVFNIARNVLGLSAAILFFRLPLIYHVSQSIGITYQLALVGMYGGCRVVDTFFITPYLFGHIPRRVRYKHADRVETPNIAEALSTSSSADSPSTKASKAKGTGTATSDAMTIGTSASNMLENVVRRCPTAASDSYFLLHRTISGPRMQPVLETATTEDGWPDTLLGRMEWALELELSMRGAGWTWTTADVRHTRKTWLPTVQNKLHSIFLHVIPAMIVCVAIIRSIYTTYIEPHVPTKTLTHEALNVTAPSLPLFDAHLPFAIQLLLTTTLGTFLMLAFSLAHSLSAIILSSLAPHPLSYFPTLYTTRAWSVTSVRTFWSYAWHRLFARLFLVYGSWPGEHIERILTGKSRNEPADVGKVLGAFLSSASVHSFAAWTVLGGDVSRALGEAKFFTMNGIAVVFEEVVRREVVKIRRRRQRQNAKKQEKKTGNECESESEFESYWYDAYISRIWWMTVLVVSGRQFCRGWVESGLVREMAGK